MNQKGSIIKELDLYTFYDIRTESKKKVQKKVLVQYLGALYEDGGKNQVLLKISDGHVWERVAPFRNVLNRINQGDLHLFDVLQAEIIFHKNSLLIMLNFEVIYTGLSGSIGRAVSYDNFKTNLFLNPEGSTIIPEVCWNDQLEKEQDSRESNTMEEEDILDDIDEIDEEKECLQHSSLKESNFESESCFTDIRMLSKRSKTWILKARLIGKSNVKKFSRGFNDHKAEDGQVVNYIFQDNSGKIQLTLFNQQAQTYQEMLQEGQVYMISECGVRAATKYNRTKHVIELVGNKMTVIKTTKDKGKIINNYLNLKTVEELKEVDQNTLVDLICAVKTLGKPQIMELKSGRTVVKTELEVYDQSKYEVICTFWSQVPNLMILKEQEIILLRNVVLKEFRGRRSLNFGYASRIETNLPNVKKLRELKKFTKKEDKILVTISPSFKPSFDILTAELISLEEMKKDAEEKLLGDGEDNQVCYFTTQITLKNFPKYPYYTACGAYNCFKKLQPFEITPETNPIPLDSQQSTKHNSPNNKPKAFYCPKCDRVTDFKIMRYFFSAQFGDFSDNCWIYLNKNENAEKLFGLTAEELEVKNKTMDDFEFQDWKDSIVNRSYVATIMAKKNVWEGKESVRYTVLKLWNDRMEIEDANDKDGMAVENPLKQTIGKQTKQIIQGLTIANQVLINTLQQFLPKKVEISALS